MGHNAGKITAPVNTDDVRAVLGENTYDTGTLCMSDKINRWAKFKPLAIDQKEDITDAQRAQFGYGIRDIPFFTNPYNMAMLIYEESLRQDNGVPILNEYFTYARPYEAMLKRLTDFAGYDHNALPPLFAPDEDEFQLGSDTDLTISFGVNKSTNHVELFDLSLFPSGAPTHLRDYYLGAIITDGDIYAMAIQQTPVSALYLNGGSVTFSQGGVAGQSNKPVAVCAILSPVPEVFQPAPSDDTPYVPLLFALKTITINYKPEPMVATDLSAWNNSTNLNIIIRITMQNRNSMSWTISSPTFVIRDSNNAVLLEFPISNFELPTAPALKKEVSIPYFHPSASNVLFKFNIEGKEFSKSTNLLEGSPPLSF